MMAQSLKAVILSAHQVWTALSGKLAIFEETPYATVFI
jgi:hypothetical protein